jgi:hypothetical protein
VAAAALRRGLAAVLPLALLGFLAPAELERQVRLAFLIVLFCRSEPSCACVQVTGERELDLALLRRQTRYRFVVLCCCRFLKSIFKTDLVSIVA